MKQFAFVYISIAAVWAALATGFGAGNVPGASVSYNFGRNIPSAIIWPVGVVTSPYTLYKWATRPSRTPAFQTAYSGCMAVSKSEAKCDCAIDLMQKSFTEGELKTIDAQMSAGTVSEKFQTYALKAASQCH